MIYLLYLLLGFTIQERKKTTFKGKGFAHLRSLAAKILAKDTGLKG